MLASSVAVITSPVTLCITSGDKRRHQIMRTTILILISVFIAACNTATVQNKSDVILPKWIEEPAYPGHVAITTSAQPQQMGGIDAQRRVAHMLARAEMARIKSSSVQSRSTTEITSSSSGVTINADDLRRISSIQALRLNDVKVIEEWIHPESGELYMWLAYPVDP
jgi:hypothetical protein